MDPVQLVAEVTSLVLPKASERGLRIHTHFQFPLPDRIDTDVLRIRLILLNLCSHALSCAKQGSIVIELGFDAETQQLNFYVTDQAAGELPPQSLLLFDPFKQAELMGAILLYEKRPDADSAYRLAVPAAGTSQARLIENAEQLAAHREIIPLPSELASEGPEFEAIIDQFVGKLPELLAAIALAYLADERSKVLELVHNLKGMGGGFGYPQLTELAIEIESLSNDDNYRAIAPVISALNHLASQILVARLC